MSTEHELDSSWVHYAWNNAMEPRLRVRSGDLVTIDIRGGGDNFFTPRSVHDDVLKREFRGHPLTGPIYVADAQSGDALRIDIVSVATWSWGYTWVAPGWGLLGDEVTSPFLHIWDLSDGESARFRDDLRVPIEPFLGVLGVAPSEPGEHSTTPPRRVGGNLDIRQLTAGATLWLPVEVEGALFSAGDAHAAQGDGEIGISAIETGAKATVRLTVEHARWLRSPEFITAGPLTPRTNSERWFASCGVGPDLIEASREAARGAVSYLQRRYNLGFEEALCLASVTVDLKISEVVDQPNWVVSAFLPMSIFK